MTGGVVGGTVGARGAATLEARSAVAALARRDDGIPGLAVLLDDEALSLALGREVTITRVRYKAGTSVLAAFAGPAGHGWAAAYSGPDKVRPGQRRGGEVTLLSGVAHGVTGPVFADRALRLAVRDAERGDPSLLDAAVIVRHNPGRRLVVADSSRVAKLFAVAPADPAAPARTDELLRRHGVPVLAQTRLGERAWSTPRWGVGDLSERPSAAAARRAGAALARLHRVPAPSGARPSDVPGDATAAARAIDAVLPHLGSRAHRVAEHVHRRAADAPAPRQVLVHGDFSADQVLVDAAGDVRMIDFDRAGLGDPARDLAGYAVDAALRGSGTLAFGDLLGGYAAEGGAAAAADAAAWQQWIPACALSRAIEPFRRCAPDWPQQVERALALAEEGMP